MSFAIHHGDVSAVLATMEAASFDACLCDPPYGLSFMGKAWDHGIPGPDVWREVLRVLKPGAPLLAFGGTRTFHRLVCAIEDSGFEIRDCLAWIYGSGFPKSLDIGKALDKRAGAERVVIGETVRLGDRKAYANTSMNGGKYGSGTLPVVPPIPITAPSTDAAKLWDGYGTALKPAFEPISLAMKPCDGTFAENAISHGVAGLNIKAGRVPSGESWHRSIADNPAPKFDRTHAQDRWTKEEMARGANTDGNALGRWPANVVLDEESAAALDAQSGDLHPPGTSGQGTTFGSGSAKRGPSMMQSLSYHDHGGASRFFYCAKASPRERANGGPNTHPTVKPVTLTTYLAKLLLPPDQGETRRILVPFCGSGSEIMGALRAGWDEAVGIEISAEYCDLALRRIAADGPLLNQVEALA